MDIVFFWYKRSFFSLWDFFKKQDLWQIFFESTHTHTHTYTEDINAQKPILIFSKYILSISNPLKENNIVLLYDVSITRVKLNINIKI